ncbi:MAG: hypothetical protein KJ579_12205, partial [Verrucomicrobia bacterium]|nr:hypothetical protein [Verrucomicrobiota bacterium]
MKRRSRAAAARTSTRLLAGCAGWVAACCILLPAAYPARARDVAIANEGLRVGFRIDGGRCTLTEITDLQRPHNFLDPEAGTQVWRIDLVDTEGRPVVLADGGAEPIVQTNSAFSREHLSLTWTNAGRGGTACDVTVHVQLRDDPVRAELRIEARPGPRVGIAAVHFPAIANLRPIGDGADDRLAYPYGAGRRASDPAHSLETMRLHYSSHNCSLQMFALYDAAHGLYLATEDGAMHAKRYHLSHTNGAMTWALEQHPAVLNRPGEAYAQPYPTVVAPFAGDYLDAAKIYRR